MVPVILIDANIEGHGAHIWMRLQTNQWREFTTNLDVSFRTFGKWALTPQRLTMSFGGSARAKDSTC
jgi:hypothetical protein